jgi:hypothetical protein
LLYLSLKVLRLLSTEERETASTRIKSSIRLDLLKGHVSLFMLHTSLFLF